jgi:hypothetical protein
MSEITFFVITWNYHDLSSFGVVGVRDNIDAAERLVKFMRKHCDGKVFSIHETTMEPT